MTLPEYPSQSELKELLNDRYELYNRKSFIENDPVCIPHLFENEDDIAISGFLTATIAWGQRPVLIRNARKMMQWMDDAPADYIRHFRESDLDRMQQFVHRTFSGAHLKYMLRALQQVLLEEGNLELAFRSNEPGVYAGITSFRKRMLRMEDDSGVSRHIADPETGSAAKRLNMFLRWMVRNDNRGVDFGIWKLFSPSELICPLDVHSGGVARKLGLLKRKQDDRKAAEELTEALRAFDAEDPVKYDFALFGLGVNEGFRKS